MVKVKNKKAFIGLIAITIVVVAAVVCVIYFVDKYMDVELEQISINQEVQNDEYSFKVLDLQKEDSSEKTIIRVNIVIEAKKSLKLKERDFKVNGAVPISSENFSSSLGENEKVEFSLYYEIESEQLQFLEYDKYKVALGNIM